jgi:hypothetical protein
MWVKYEIIHFQLTKYSIRMTYKFQYWWINNVQFLTI